MYGKIIGCGSYLPKKILTNKDLEKMVETSDEWITERTGIKQRHIIDAKEESASRMSVFAAKKAIEDAGIDSDEIDLIIVATTTSNMIFPSIASMVQKEIGNKKANCFDMNSACPGWLQAFNVAQAMMNSNMVKTALVIGVEALSNFMDWEDRGTCILFGDGAGACVVRAAEDAVYEAVMHADGSRGECLSCESKMQRRDDAEFAEATKFFMNGKDVFRFAVSSVPKVIIEVLEKESCAASDVDLFVLHQANQRIIESVSKRLDVGIEKFPMNIARTGNTSAASIPILLDELKRDGKLKEGMKLVLSSFGGGLTWGAARINW